MQPKMDWFFTGLTHTIRGDGWQASVVEWEEFSVALLYDDTERLASVANRKPFTGSDHLNKAKLWLESLLEE